MRMRKTDEAIELLRKSSAASPNFWPIHQFLGIGYAEKGDPDAARLAYGRSIALAPQMSFNHFALAEAEAKQGHKSAALRSYREAHALEPSNPLYLIALLEAEKPGGNTAVIAGLSTALKLAIADERVPERMRRRAEAALKDAGEK